jgi:RQC domain
MHKRRTALAAVRDVNFSFGLATFALVLVGSGSAQLLNKVRTAKELPSYGSGKPRPQPFWKEVCCWRQLELTVHCCSR